MTSKTNTFISALTVILVAGGSVMATGSAGASSVPKAKVTIGSKTYKFSGGACSSKSNEVQIAISSGANTLTITGHAHKGKYSNANTTMIVNSKLIIVAPNSGSFNAKGGKFKGSAAPNSGNVTGSYTC